MRMIVKYGCYTLLAIAVFVMLWGMGWFISNEYNYTCWSEHGRAFLIILWVVINSCVIGYKENI